MEKLTQEQIDEKLVDFPEWTQIGDTIQRTFRFDDFLGSMAFISRVADLAEEQQHHPDILIRYNKVTLTLSTHDAGGITERDFTLSRAMDSCGAVA
ncbi:MAG: 4a-hydroxytetrahydrobiopterin dehydratase [Planctomycetota bacterium]|nr:4a-hydroxytetrahydrobiopterin dehydratase [Planctomycetota bacterium]